LFFSLKFNCLNHGTKLQGFKSAINVADTVFTACFTLKFCVFVRRRTGGWILKKRFLGDKRSMDINVLKKGFPFVLK